MTTTPNALLTPILTVIAGVGLLMQTPANVTVTDVSPDAAYGNAGSNDEPTGQIDAIAIDPSNPSILYASAETSGVWKSIDGGRNWTQAGTGLRWGATSVAGPVLAVDAANPQRLLFATEDDDLSPPTSTGSSGWRGGLYVSLDAAAHWRQVALPNCTSPAIENVLFSGGKAFAATACGLAVSTSHDLSVWQLIRPGAGLATQSIYYVAAQDNFVYACDENRHVFRSPDLGVTWAGAPTVPDVPGTCYGLAVVPDDTNRFLVVYQSSDGSFHVAMGNTAPGTQTMADLPPLPADKCCGYAFVYAVRAIGLAAGGGLGKSYDVFASNKFNFFQYVPAQIEQPAHWETLKGLHSDTHGLAFQPNFGADAQSCRLYAATDGGVSMSSGKCPVVADTFVQASHGLHAFGSFSIAGVPRAIRACGRLPAPCPALYVPSNDNGTWASPAGRQGTAGAWHDMHCCGDSGGVYVDPRLATVAATTRNGFLELWTSPDADPPIVGINNPSAANIIPAQGWAFTQVATLPGQQVLPHGDFLAITSPTRAGGTGDDQIVRNVLGSANAADWISVGATLAPSLAWDIQTSNGHLDTYIYVLTANDQPQLGARQGAILQGRAGFLGTVQSWTGISSGVTRAAQFAVDPYDPNIVYVLDLGDPDTAGDDVIKFTTNATSAKPTWQPDVALTHLATAGGRYRLACGSPTYPAGPHVNAGPYSYRYQCALNGMAFAEDHPDWRFAVLNPAGVMFSRDRGSHWIPLNVTRPLDRPVAAFYDATPDPRTGRASLYVALHGHGVIRVEAPFETLSAP